MPEATNTTTTDTTGGGWIDFIGPALQLLGQGVGAASASTTQCGKKCRGECSAQYGTFQFSAKNKCKKACKAKCFAQTNEPPTKPISTITIVIAIVLVILVVVIIWWMLKKK